MHDFLLPDIGEGLHEAEIIKWFVEVGEFVKINSLLVEVQTDKAVVEITSPVTGVVSKLGGSEGEVITVGSLLCQFQLSDSPAIQPENTSKEEKVINAKTPPKKTEISAIGRVKAAPSVRKAARKANIDIEKVAGSGPNGRVLLRDLENYHTSISNEEPKMVVEKKAEIKQINANPEVIPIRGLRKTIFENMQKAVSNAVLCTGMDKVNVTKLVEFRDSIRQLPEMQNKNLTYLPFILKAVVYALQKNKQFNATVDEEEKALIIHPNIHLGVAVATDTGLLVPVIRNAQSKSILEIANELEELLEKIKTKKITANELKGSTFTVSSTGKEGGIFATPITNYPEVAILGVHKITKEPVVINDELAIGHTMTMSCTFDHRVIDGEPAGKFMRDIAAYLEHPSRFAL